MRPPSCPSEADAKNETRDNITLEPNCYRRQFSLPLQKLQCYVLLYHDER